MSSSTFESRLYRAYRDETPKVVMLGGQGRCDEDQRECGDAGTYPMTRRLAGNFFVLQPIFRERSKRNGGNVTCGAVLTSKEKLDSGIQSLAVQVSADRTT